MITKLTSIVNRIWSKFSMKYGAISMKKAYTLFMSVVKHPVCQRPKIRMPQDQPNPQGIVWLSRILGRAATRVMYTVVLCTMATTKKSYFKFYKLLPTSSSKT